MVYGQQRVRFHYFTGSKLSPSYGQQDVSDVLCSAKQVDLISLPDQQIVSNYSVCFSK